MYFSLKTGSLKSYLQWFPFTKLSEKDKNTISSEDFYNQYIKTGSFILFPSVMHQSENFLQKSDGSFRDSSLVGPILYLVLQSVGKEISNQYTSVRPANVSVYYAGNYEHLRPKYKQDYDDFFKELNASIDEYQYFIKTDITNFFANINVDKLVAQIDKVCNTDDVAFSQTQLHLFKELLIYCGNGRFPLIENSVASSFLATIVYLDVIDGALHDYISNKIKAFSNFRMVRYVDDLYILISTDKPIGYLHDAYNEIRNEYSSILKEFGLALNTKKCCIKESKEINQELKKSLYDEYFNGQKHSIEELFSGSLQGFLSDLSLELLFDSMQILYGYPNYDCYDLRLDFSHKGQEVVHFNNETPGGLSCCIFNKNEFQNIIDQYPELKDCFISYDDRWALKERINCELTDDIKVSFDRVRKEKAHDPFFTQSYLEKDINDFINLVSKMLPKECRRAIDLDGTYAKLCFNYDVIMRDTTLLYLAYLARDSKRVDMVAEWISDKAFRYGLTSEKINIDTLGQVLEIIKTAESRI